MSTAVKPTSITFRSGARSSLAGSPLPSSDFAVSLSGRVPHFTCQPLRRPPRFVSTAVHLEPFYRPTRLRTENIKPASIALRSPVRTFLGRIRHRRLPRCLTSSSWTSSLRCAGEHTAKAQAISNTRVSRWTKISLPVSRDFLNAENALSRVRRL